MEDAKRQQFLKQQQQQHFHKQQEQLRKEQRLRHTKTTRRQNEQLRQQELLKSLQNSTASEGSTVVHVTPEYDTPLQESEVHLNGDLQATPNTPPLLLSNTLSLAAKDDSATEVFPESQKSSTAMATTHSPETQGTTSEHTDCEPPNSELKRESPTNPPSTSPVTETKQSGEDSRVVLKDGTQIIIQQVDKILFIGPTGVKMVVNCLPLYNPPQDILPTNISTSPPPSSTTDSNLWKPFRKAKSLSSVAINEIELSDEEKSTRSDDEQLQDSCSNKNPRRKRSRFGTNSYVPLFSVQVHTRNHVESVPVDSNTLEDDAFEEETPKLALSDKSNQTESSDPFNKNIVDGTSFNGINSDNGQDSGNSIEQATDTSEPEKGAEFNPLESGNTLVRNHSPNRRRSSSTGSMAEVDDRSDSEEPKGLLEVNYCSTTLPRLKRSSGSVSFPQRISTVADSIIQPDGVQQTGLNVKEKSDSSTANHQSLNHELDTTSTVNSTSHTTDPAVASISNPLTPSLLPPWPTTVDQVYLQRSGWLNKLSHRKGVFGDKWQKRYFVLHRSWVYYFKKYGDSNPKGAIRLLPTGWSKPVHQGTPRMHDAVVNSNEATPAILSVLRCFAVHRPNNFAASLTTLLGTDGVAEAFRCQTISVRNSQHSSRTFYMTASSDDERDAWVEAVMTNIQIYSHSDETLTTASRELRSMLRAVKSNAPPKDIPCLLLLLHSKLKEVEAKQLDSSLLQT